MATKKKTTSINKKVSGMSYTLASTDASGNIDTVGSNFWESPEDILIGVGEDEIDDGDAIVEIKVIGYIRKGITIEHV
jgi:hypothetical protein